MTNKKLSIRPMIKEDYYNFTPAEKHIEMLRYAQMNEQFIELVNSCGGGYVLVDDTDKIIMMMGGIIISHCTAEVWLIFGVGFETYIKSCIKALRMLILEKIPNHIYRLEANVYLEDVQAYNLLEKLLGFKMVGIRSKLGFKGEDVILLERLL